MFQQLRQLIGRLDTSYYRLEKLLVTIALVVMALTVFLDVVHRRMAVPDSAISNLILWPVRANIQRQVRQAVGGPSKTEAQVELEVNERIEPIRERLNERVAPVILSLLTYLLVLLALHTIRRYRSKNGDEDEPESEAASSDHGPDLSRRHYAAATALCFLVSLILVRLPTTGIWVGLVLTMAAAIFLDHLFERTRMLWRAGAISAGFALIVRLMVYCPSRWTFLILLAGGIAGLCLDSKFRGRSKPMAVILVSGLIGALLLYRIIPEGFSWAKEVAMILLLWVGFLGCSMAAFTRQHILIDFVRKMVPPRHKWHYEGISALVAAGFCGLLTYLGYLYVFGAEMSIYAMDATFEYTGLPSWIGVASIPIGLGTTSLRFLGLAVKAFRGEVEERVDPHAPALPTPDEEEGEKDKQRDEEAEAQDEPPEEEARGTENGGDKR